MQANSNAREGRVMIYNLVEAAQEFLSEVIPQEQTHESVWSIYFLDFSCKFISWSSWLQELLFYDDSVIK